MCENVFILPFYFAFLLFYNVCQCIFMSLKANWKAAQKTDSPVLIWVLVQFHAGYSISTDSLCLTALLCTAAHSTFTFICLANYSKLSFFPTDDDQILGAP